MFTINLYSNHLKVCTPELMTENNMLNELGNVYNILNVNIIQEYKSGSNAKSTDVECFLRSHLNTINLFNIEYTMFN